MLNCMEIITTMSDTINDATLVSLHRKQDFLLSYNDSVSERMGGNPDTISVCFAFVLLMVTDLILTGCYRLGNGLFQYCCS